VVSFGAPVASLGSSPQLCNGQSVQLTPIISSGAGPFTYSYSPATGLDNPNIESPTATPAVTTTYQVSVTDANGCVGTASVTVVVNQYPQVSAGTNASICEGQTVTLSGSAPVTFP